MEQKEKIKYQRNCLLGALGAALLIVGDLCISIVPASPADKGLYVRGAYLSEHIGREQAIAYVDDYYNLLFPAVSIAYIPTALLMLTSLISLLAGRTVMKRSMIVFHIITWQLIFVLIPDIRQAMGADISTLDYVFSQASGNTACLIWLVASFVYSKRNSN